MLTRLSCSVAQNKKPFRDDFRHPPPADLNILGYRVIPSLHHFVICKSNDVGLLFVMAMGLNAAPSFKRARAGSFGSETQFEFRFVNGSEFLSHDFFGRHLTSFVRWLLNHLTKVTNLVHYHSLSVLGWNYMGKFMGWATFTFLKLSFGYIW